MNAPLTTPARMVEYLCGLSYAPEVNVMKYVLSACLILLLACPVMAWDDDEGYEIRSKKTDHWPGDGYNEAGSPSNPFIMEKDGETYEIRTRRPDRWPGDGYNEAGSPTNPWIIEKKRR